MYQLMRVDGPVARVEPTPGHQQFVRAASPNWIEIKLHHAEHLVDRGVTASEWAGPGSNVLVTTTIQDERLRDYTWAEQRDIIRQFDADLCVPADVSVFREQSTRERAELIANCMEGAAFMKSELAPYGIGVIPLLKGYTKREREICLEAVDAMGVDQVALYVTRYFSAKRGNSRNELFRYLDRCGNHDLQDAILLGLLSPTYLERVPDWVVAAAGQNQWRQRVSVQQQSESEIKHAWTSLRAEVEDALSIGGNQQSNSTGTDSISNRHEAYGDD